MAHVEVGVRAEVEVAAGSAWATSTRSLAPPDVRDATSPEGGREDVAMI